MCSLEEFTQMALELNGASEKPHFDRTSFRTKKIFATLDTIRGSANLKLSLEDQSTFSAIAKDAIYPVNNKWGMQGWTTFELKALEAHLVADALQCAHRESLKKPKK